MSVGTRSVGTPVTGIGAGPVLVPVPAGVQADDIVEVGFFVENGATITPPSGFTLRVQEGTNVATRGRLALYWKRLTAADTGTYSFGISASDTYDAVAVARTGCVRAGDPYETHATGTSSGTSTLTVSATVTQTSNSAGLTVIGSNHATDAGAWTPPSGMTEQYDGSGAGVAHLTFDTQDGTAPGSYSKTVTGTGVTGNSVPKTINAVLMADKVVQRAYTSGAPASAAAFTPTLPTHVTDDMLLLVVQGKYETTTIPTINQGWTLIKSGTGGTGSAGADTGQVFTAVYAKVATSSAETAPTVTPGGTAPNTWTWMAFSYVHATGQSWTDSIGSNVDWVQLISDTSTTTPLTGTASAMTGQPTTGDALLAVGGIPTDSGAALSPSPTMTATGLANGVVTAVTTQYVENALNDDFAQAWFDYTGFTGPASSGITASMVHTSATNLAGTIAVIALRQSTPSTTVTGGTATETDTGQAGSVVLGGAVISGGMAAVTATVLAGTVLVGALVVGGQTGETNSAQAGSATQGQVISGGTATESDTAATGTAVAGAVVAGGAAVETDAALAGAAAQTLHGGTATETDTAATGTVRYVVVGGIAVETDSALAGALSTGGDVITGDQVVETDTALAGTVSAGYLDTITSDNVYALMFSGDADVTWEPAVVPRPATMTGGESEIAARAYVLDEISDTGQATYTSNEVVTRPSPRWRITIGGRDLTYPVDGAELQVPDFERMEPFGPGDGGTLVLPHIDARFAKLGAGLLHRVKLGATVKYQRVDPETNEVLSTPYVGVVLMQRKTTTSGTGGQWMPLQLQVAGELLGRAALRNRPVPIFRRIRDAGVQIYQVVTGMRIRMSPRLQHIGIKLAARGGMREDQWLTDSTAQLTTDDGDQWTIVPTYKPTGTGPYTLRLKDRETVNATVYIDNSLASADLGDDLSEKPNRVWINAVAADGHRIMNASAPGLVGIDVPQFPTYLGGPMVQGATDADTSTGDGVTVLIWRLTFTGKLDKDDLPGGFDADVADAVRQFQVEAGCASLTGAVTEETWNKLWDNLVTGYTTAYAAQRPAYEANAVQKFDRAGNGAIVGLHNGYDETAVVVDLTLDEGPVASRRQAFRMAKGRLRQVGDTDWVGTITLTSGLIAGLHNPGDPLTSDLILDKYDVEEGWNLWVPYWDDVHLTGDGGTLFHVSAVKPSRSSEEVTLVVDTRARDAMEAWAVHQRRADNRYQPSRYLGEHPRRRSTAIQDVLNPWDKIVGQTDRPWSLAAGWNLVLVPAGQAGTVQLTSIELDKPAEFAAFFAQKPPPMGRLARKIQPLTEPPPDPQRHRIVISGTPTGGHFTLDGNSDTTGDLAHDATTPAVQAAIRGLGGAFSDATVTGVPGGPWTVAMHGAESDINVGTNALTGGHEPSISVTSTGGGVNNTPWYELEDIRAWLKPYGVPVSWGTWDDPMGYDDTNASRAKLNANGVPTGAPITGLFHDEDSWGYDLGLKGAAINLLIYVAAPNRLPRQRILTVQLDGSGT